jgi:hypothetical protein
MVTFVTVIVMMLLLCFVVGHCVAFHLDLESDLVKAVVLAKLGSFFEQYLWFSCARDLRCCPSLPSAQAPDVELFNGHSIS